MSEMPRAQSCVLPSVLATMLSFHQAQSRRAAEATGLWASCVDGTGRLHGKRHVHSIRARAMVAASSAGNNAPFDSAS